MSQCRSVAASSYGGGVGHREAVDGAGVQLGAVRHPGLGERALDEVLLLGRHRAVVVRMGDVDLAADAAEGPVGAVGCVRGEPTAVEAGDGGDSVGCERGRAQRKSTAHAVADGADRPSGDALVGCEEVQVRRCVPHRAVRGQRRHQRAQLLEDRGPVLGADRSPRSTTGARPLR